MPAARLPIPAIRPAFHSTAPSSAKRAPCNGVLSRRGNIQIDSPRPAIEVHP
jgi:hypothetical protein